MKKHFSKTDTAIPGLHIIERNVTRDLRGFFSRLYCVDELAPAGWTKPIAQINHTFSLQAGTIRGLHFQRPPKSEMKLVICLKGAIFDVALDLREHSPTFLGHHPQVLDSAHNSALLIPEGCAHGFQSLTDDVELIYLHSEVYSPEDEGGFSPFDPRLEIKWPLPVSTISERDSRHPNIPPDFKGLSL